MELPPDPLNDLSLRARRRGTFGANVAQGLRSLVESWERAVLSAVGVLVGAAAVVLLVSIAQGVRDDISGEIREIGANVLIVIPGRIESGTFNPNLGGLSYLSDKDIERLRQVPGVARVEPFTFVGGGIRRGKKTATPLLAATTAGWFKMHPTKLAEGRVLSPEDDGQDVVVLGSLAKGDLFANESAIGKSVEVNQRRYTVVGVTQDQKQEQSLMSFGSFQNLVYLPYQRLKKTQAQLPLSRIMIQGRTDAEPKRLLAALDRALGERLDHQQYQVLTQEDLLGLVYRLSGILTWLLTGLTSISLFVGGVGIMAIMLMSVAERTKEIGIRKTVGARRRDIFLQFMVEAATISLVGGSAGLGLGAAVDAGLAKWTPIKPDITPGVVALALGLSLGIGVLFGLLPAMRASRRDPVDAIRAE
jgi:putative ABC transport system permease protein